MGYRFVHAADLHLDSPFEGVGAVSPEMAAILREASLDAFDALVDLTIERDAAFLLLAGDVYDGAERGVRAQLRFLAGLRRLSEAGIRAFIVHGNHDPLGGWPGVRAWPEGVHVFAPGEVGVEPVERAGEVIAVVQGVSYGRSNETDDLAARFRPAAGPGLKVGVVHANVGGQPGHEPYAPCSLATLETSGFDYWALGHVHQHGVLREGGPWVVYPGTTQGRSLKPGERGAKGAVVVDVEGRTVRSVEFVPVDRARFEVVELDVAEVADIGELSARLRHEGERLRRLAEGRHVVVRAILGGRGPVHIDLGCRGGVEDLLRDLREDCEGCHPVLWWESVRDATRPEIDLDAVRGRDDFAAAVVARADPLLRDATASSYVARVLAAEAPARVQAEAPALDEEAARLILEEARALALDLLEEQVDSCA